MSPSALKNFIRERARELGFTHTGVAKVERLDEEARRLEEWLNRGYHGQMGYMANHFEKRVDPGKLVPGARSVISLLFNYQNPQMPEDPEAPKISRYAYGKDYHFVLKDKLKALLRAIRDKAGDINGRCFVDSAPVMERQWAERAGNGWTGKNTLLIHPRSGSWFFLAELITDLELEPDAPMGDHCGTCTRCIDACPTEAIAARGYLLDASRCISYLTIELRDALPDSFRGKMDNWIFGCDVCQEVCPWNRFATRHNEAELEPTKGLLEMRKEDWKELTEEVFRDLFRKSAVNRTKFSGLQRNIRFLDQA